MIKILLALILISNVSYADTWLPGKGMTTVQTADGTTVCQGVNTGIFSNGTVTCGAGTATITNTGGGGAVSSVSNTDKTLIISPTTGTVIAGINWTDINSIANINTGGINWTNFSPSGIMKFNGQSAPTTATATDVAGLFTACSGTQYLGADGACHNNGTGTVTSASVTTANGISGSVANPTTTPAITLTPFLYMSGINWDDAWNLQKANINWGQVNTLTAQNLQTIGNGSTPGFFQFWNAAKSFYIKQSVNSGVNASYGINWPGAAPASGTVPEVLDAFGDMNWVSVSTIGGVTSVSNSDSSLTISPTTGAVVGGINWQNVNALIGTGSPHIQNTGINWQSMYVQTQAINWSAPMSAPQFTANGTGSAIVNIGVCTSHTGVMACIGTGGCAGYVSAFTAYNNLTCNCC